MHCKTFGTPSTQALVFGSHKNLYIFFAASRARVQTGAFEVHKKSLCFFHTASGVCAGDGHGYSELIII